MRNCSRALWLLRSRQADHRDWYWRNRAGVHYLRIGVDDEDGDIIKTADELAHQVAYIQQQRPDLMIPYEIAIIGKAYTKGWSVVEAYNSPGGSWCLEILAPLLGSHEEMLNRVRSGPPKE